MAIIVQGPDGYFKDRRTGLIIFGILQILLGLLCLGFTVLMGGLMIATQDFGENNANLGMGSIAPALLIYTLGACWFITMGIGSALCRRWARDLILVCSCMWLVIGIFSMCAMCLIFPGMSQRMPSETPMPGLILAVMLLFMAIIYLVIPGVLIAFYRSPHVRATCRHYDTTPRWTERVPLPVLAICLLCMLSPVSLVSMALYNWTFPVFGHVFTGAPGAAIVMVMLLASLYIGWGFYHLDMRAWWIAIVAGGIMSLSAIISFSVLDWREIYERMGLPEEQIKITLALMPDFGYQMVTGCVIGAIFWLCYLLYLRRFFLPQQ